jgi:hypothetical protein
MDETRVLMTSERKDAGPVRFWRHGNVPSGEGLIPAGFLASESLVPETCDVPV